MVHSSVHICNIFKPIYCLAQILLCPLESFHLHYQYAELIALQDPSNSAITFQLTVGAMYHERSNPGFVCSAALFHGHSDSPALAMHGVGIQLSHLSFLIRSSTILRTTDVAVNGLPLPGSLAVFYASCNIS